LVGSRQATLIGVFSAGLRMKWWKTIVTAWQQEKKFFVIGL